MTRFDVAHLNRQGIDLIIVFVNPNVGRKPKHEQDEIIAALQLAANEVGWKGSVVPVWSHHGGYQFIAPPNWHPFFQSVTYQDLRANINKFLDC